nr:Chain F, EncC targeting peptide [Myxococcus xanthus]7S4Q_G Chain G, EncC targeting peptide [Myxococcus xanthus]7S4Q_H Chain H, EncC targeting peptide [Myxococcus xanthus]
PEKRLTVGSLRR